MQMNMVFPKIQNLLAHAHYLLRSWRLGHVKAYFNAGCHCSSQAKHPRPSYSTKLIFSLDMRQTAW